MTRRASEPGRKLADPVVIGRASPVLITGGCGFIGSNLADSFLNSGEEVIVFDNLSRNGVKDNLDWLEQRHGNRVHRCIADLRQETALDAAVRDARAIFHFAAQTAVTSSLDHPIEDFEINARGTLNLLEAVRRAGGWQPVVFASTNKVYGSLSDLALVECVDCHLPTDDRLRIFGVDEDRSIDCCTPYGCSKGVADQYMLDYAASYGLKSAVLRMSCVYGPRQFGTEDQGWVAHFLIRALNREAITIFGDGKQVRDVLHVDDAVLAYRGILDAIDAVSGRAFNLGGGHDNAVSLAMVLDEIAGMVGEAAKVTYEPARIGDQLYYVSDTRRLQSAIGWSPTVAWRSGLRDLHAWLEAERGMHATRHHLSRRLPA